MRQLHLAGALLLALLTCALPAQALGQKRLTTFDTPAPDAVTLANAGRAATIYLSLIHI